MALQRDTLYPGRFETGDSAHPQGAFRNRTTPTAQDGSYLEEQWLNDWDGFFASLLDKAGLTPDGNVDEVGASQYFTALQTVANGNYVTAGSTGNVITLADTSVTEYVEPLVINFKATAANTGATSLNVNGLGAVTVYGSAGLACQGGEIVPGYTTVVYSSTLSGFVIVHCTGANKQVPDAAKSHHATTLSQVPMVSGIFSGLSIGYDGTTGIVTVTANMLTLRNANNMSKVLHQVSKTATAGTITGAVNGLDTGSWNFNTCYHLFVIYNPTTDTTGLLWSLSATSPTLPTGYTYFARIGANYTQSATHYWFLGANQIDRKFQFVLVSGSNKTAHTVLASGTQGSTSTPTFVGVSLSPFIPDTVNVAEIAIRSSSAPNQILAAPTASYGTHASTTNPPPLFITNSSTTAIYKLISAMIVLESSKIYVAINDSVGYVYLFGWEDNL